MAQPDSLKQRRSSWLIAALALALVALTAVLIVSLQGFPGDRIETPPTGDDGVVPWTGDQPLQDLEDFYFAVVTDRTGEHRAGVFPLAMDKLNLVKPAFVVSVGDLIEGYTDNLDTLNNQWKEVEDYVGQLKMPFFYVPGNHDLSNEVMAHLWKEKFGPSYYHFRYRDVLFLTLNSELFSMVNRPGQSLPGPWTLEKQMDWARQVLAENDDVRWTFVFVHQPLWDNSQVHPQWKQMETLLAGRKHTVFAGHVHSYTLHRRNDSNYITLATTGGGSELRGASAWGEFDHFALVRMGAERPDIVNLELDGIHGHDVRTEAERDIVRNMSTAVELVPGVHDSEFFTSGRASFKITNNSPSPFDVKIAFHPPAGYQTQTAGRELTLPSKNTEYVHVPVRARSKSLANIGSMDSMRVDFSLSTKSPDQDRSLMTRVERSWVPDYLFTIPQPAKPVQVDGDAFEWPSPRFTVANPMYVSGSGNRTGSEDLSFSFDLQADRRFLYALIKVRDDSRVSSRDRVARLQDMVNLNIDARPEPEMSRNYGSLGEAARSGALAGMILPFLPLVETPADPALQDFGVGPVKGLQHAVSVTADGYNIEAAIPRALLARAAGGQKPDRIRINLLITDFDEGEPGFIQAAWRTPRYVPGAVPASGIFLLPPAE